MDLAGAERLFKLMDEKPEVDQGQIELVQKDEKSWAWKDAQGTFVPLMGDVRFSHVDFSYIDGKRILTDLSLYAKPGQKIAFVGATGSW